MDHETTKLNDDNREIWDSNAEAWDAKIGGGGGWQTVLIAPTVERMLNIQMGESVLDIACGNGQFSRRLAEIGATVVASDFSPKMIELAKRRPSEYAHRISFQVADATNEEQLLALAEPERGHFDAAVCCNAIMDMPVIEPLFRAVAKLLKPEGRFVFSIMHPCFNGLSMALMSELPDYVQKPIYSIKVSQYLSMELSKGLAIQEQPKQQYYWHRPLHMLLNAAFANGLVMDGIEEPRIMPEMASSNPLNWSNFDMPPLLFVRLRPATTRD